MVINSNVTIVDSHFYGNQAVLEGGALSVWGTNNQNLKIANCTFEKNRASHASALTSTVFRTAEASVLFRFILFIFLKIPWIFGTKTKSVIEKKIEKIPQTLEINFYNLV